MDIIIVKYDSSKLQVNEKVKFYYALKGRDGKSGIIDYYNITFLSKGVLLLSSKHIEDIKSFFKRWNIPIDIYIATLKKSIKIEWKNS